MKSQKVASGHLAVNGARPKPAASGAPAASGRLSRRAMALIGLTVAGGVGVGVGLGVGLGVSSGDDAASSVCASTLSRELSCQGTGQRETSRLGVYPPDDESAALFVDSERFPASCPDYSPDGYPPCSALCTSFQATVQEISRLCTVAGMPVANTATFWPEFRTWYAAGISDPSCRIGANFIIAFTVVLNMEYLQLNGLTAVGRTYILSILEPQASSPILPSYDDLTLSMDTLLTAPYLSTSLSIFQQHVETILQAAQDTTHLGDVPYPVALADYPQGDASSDTCSYYPEHSDICLATRNGWAFAKTVTPVCYDPMLPQIPWACSKWGQQHFNIQSKILGVEKNLSKTPAVDRPSRCSQLAMPATIEEWWRTGSMALFLSSQSDSCLADPTVVPCGPYPYLAPRDFEYLRTWWFIFGDVHVGQLEVYCPNLKYQLWTNNKADFEETANVSTIAATRYALEAQSPVSPFPTPSTAADCPNS